MTDEDVEFLAVGPHVWARSFEDGDEFDALYNLLRQLPAPYVDDDTIPVVVYRVVGDWRISNMDGSVYADEVDVILEAKMPNKNVIDDWELEWKDE